VYQFSGTVPDNRNLKRRLKWDRGAMAERGAAHEKDSGVLPLVARKPVVTREPGRTIVTLRGAVERSTRPVLPDYLVVGLLLEDAEIVIDLGSIEFIDLAGIRALGREREFLLANRRTMSVRAPSRLARRLITMCGLDDILEEVTIDLRRPRPPLRRLVPHRFPVVVGGV